MRGDAEEFPSESVFNAVRCEHNFAGRFLFSQGFKSPRPTHGGRTVALRMRIKTSSPTQR